MKSYLYFLIPFWGILLCGVLAGKNNPNIVIIMADDLGWRDVSFHGYNDILTPNIDTLAYQGIILQNYHTDTDGSASRASFFTGKYAMRLGLQGPSLQCNEDYGLPLTERLLPMYLKKLEYSTHLIGKWNLGLSRAEYLPTNRGFDTFYGFLSSAIDYYTRDHVEPSDESYFGHDFYENTTPLINGTKYITEAFTDRAVKVIKEHDSSVGPMFVQVSHAAPHVGAGGSPLEAPLDLIHANRHIAHPARRRYAAMVQSLDKSVGNIITALAEKNILNNTLVVFISDNGGVPNGNCNDNNYGLNLPLRGMKHTPWEGAVRVPALIWHSLFQPAVWNGLFHVTDWIPTLVSAGGGIPSLNIDGINHWQSITHRKQSERKDLLVTLNNVNRFAAYKSGNYKLVVGVNLRDSSSGFDGNNLLDNATALPNYEEVLMNCEIAKLISQVSNRPLDMSLVLKKRNATILIQKIAKKDNLCMPTLEKGCLYNLSKDPFEMHDIWNTEPEIVKTIILKLRKLWSEQKPRTIIVSKNSKPSLHEYIWTPWLDTDTEIVNNSYPIPKFPLELSVEEMEYVMSEHMDSFTDKVFNYVKSVRGSVMNSMKRFFK